MVTLDSDSTTSTRSSRSQPPPTATPILSVDPSALEDNSRQLATRVESSAFREGAAAAAVSEVDHPMVPPEESPCEAHPARRPTTASATTAALRLVPKAPPLHVRIAAKLIIKLMIIQLKALCARR